MSAHTDTAFGMVDDGAANPFAAAGDGAIVAAVLDGAVDRFAELIARHQAALYRHARGMGLDPDTAEDLVQDTFIKAYSALRECRQPDRFRSWLFRILRNACLDHIKDVRTRTVPLDAAGDDAFGSDSSAELRHELRDALVRLSPLLREAFLLKHGAGYSYDDVAAITDSTASAVKMRVHRAREELRDLLILADGWVAHEA